MPWTPTASRDEPDAESLLAALAGVLSAHVVRSPSGRIVEIHILSSAVFHPKQVVRNVESALRAGLGLEVDRRVISVAQVRTASQEDQGSNGTDPREVSYDPGVASPRADEPPAPASRRLEFVRYHSRRDEDRCTCEVILRDEQREVSGSASGPNTAEGRAEAAARAVMEGVARARPGLQLQLDGATVTTARGRTYIIASAHLIRGREAIRLAGAAPLTRSPEEAAILAALQATNRWSG